jgi:hypothetical protein
MAGDWDSALETAQNVTAADAQNIEAPHIACLEP